MSWPLQRFAKCFRLSGTDEEQFVLTSNGKNYGIVLAYVADLLIFIKMYKGVHDRKTINKKKTARCKIKEDKGEEWFSWKRSRATNTTWLKGHKGTTKICQKMSFIF